MQNQRKKQLYLSRIIFIVIMILVGYISVERAIAEGSTILWLNPTAANIPPGQTTDIVVQLDDVDNVYGIEMHLAFDPAIVSVVDANGSTEGIQIQPGSCPKDDFQIVNTVDNGAGTIDYAVTQLNPTSACNGGDVSTITLQCQTAGQSDISFGASIIADADGQEIDHTTQNATIVCSSGNAVADFDGDGFTDISVYRPSNGRWFIQNQGKTQWGRDGDLPVPGDYDGDGSVDIAIFRPSNAKWYIFGNSPVKWGAMGDIPMPCDYDGDGDDDLAVYRSANGNWYVQGMSFITWGITGDIPVPADYDGDGVCDIAIFRPSNGKWLIYGQGVTKWGVAGDIPVPGDYNGDGIDDITVYRPSNGRWFIKDQGKPPWGRDGDIPVPGDYDGDGSLDIAILRPSNGKWYIMGQSPLKWYAAGDFPLPVRDTNADGDPYE